MKVMQGLGVYAGKCEWALLLLSAFWTTGCVTLRPDYVAPTVDMVSFKPLESESIVPRFEIGLRVVNPNAAKLELRGMSYALSLNGYQVVEGAANELPVVPGYGEAEFRVVARVGLIESIGFVNDLLKKSHGEVTYRFKAKLDVGALLPAIHIEKGDTFSP